MRDDYDAAYIAKLEEKNRKLQAFKDWVHNFLTQKGVPENPNPEEVERTGCRIGQRLKWIFDEYEKALQGKF